MKTLVVSGSIERTRTAAELKRRVRQVGRSQPTSLGLR
jgi:hypothetical protein